jgi:hypothetical protein
VGPGGPDTTDYDTPALARRPAQQLHRNPPRDFKRISGRPVQSQNGRALDRFALDGLKETVEIPVSPSPSARRRAAAKVPWTPHDNGKQSHRHCQWGLEILVKPVPKPKAQAPNFTPAPYRFLRLRTVHRRCTVRRRRKRYGAGVKFGAWALGFGHRM